MSRAMLTIVLLVTACGAPPRPTEPMLTERDHLTEIGIGVLVGAGAAAAVTLLFGEMYCGLTGDHGEPEAGCERAVMKSSGMIFAAGLVLGGAITTAGVATGD